MRGVENGECGKCGMWKMRDVKNAGCGKCKKIQNYYQAKRKKSDVG